MTTGKLHDYPVYAGARGLKLSPLQIDPFAFPSLKAVQSRQPRAPQRFLMTCAPMSNPTSMMTSASWMNWAVSSAARHFEWGPEASEAADGMA